MIARVIIPLFESQTDRRYALLGNLLSPQIDVPKNRIHFLKTSNPNDYEKLLREVSSLAAAHEEIGLPSLIMPNDMRLMVSWERLEFIVNYVRQKPGTFYGLQFTDDVDKSFVNVDGFLHEGFDRQFEGPMIIMPEAANILMNAPDDLPKGFYTYSDRIIAKSRWTVLNDFI